MRHHPPRRPFPDPAWTVADGIVTVVEELGEPGIRRAPANHFIAREK